MKLIVVTAPTIFVEEEQIITALFEEGLDVLHLRKPEVPAIYAERLLTLIPRKYHRRIVVHDHFYLHEEFNLMGIHLNSRHPQEPDDFDGHVSSDCYSLEELPTKRRYYDYTFLCPVFDGITYPDIPAAFTEAQLREAAKRRWIDSKVMALGGVCADNIRQVKKLGFGGAVVMGDLWHKFDPCTNRDYEEVIRHFRKLKKLVG